MIQKIFLTLAVLLFSLSVSSAQKSKRSPTLAMMIDNSIQHCYAYRFEAGDSLVYRAVSYDSVIFYGRPALSKRRVEIWTIHCDSATPDGHFFLRQTLLALSSREQEGEGESVRNESPWLNRTVFLTIDRFGRRISWRNSDTSKHAQAPGGPFQPVFLVNFRDSCKFQNESWIVERDELLPENGYPAPTRHNASIYRTLPNLDTLGEIHQRLQYTLSGKGEAVSFNERSRSAVGVGATLAEFGELRILQRLGVPAYFLGTVEEKLAFKSVRGSEISAMHKILSTYSLISISRASEVGKPPIDLAGERQGKKKSSAKKSAKKKKQ